VLEAECERLKSSWQRILEVSVLDLNAEGTRVAACLKCRDKSAPIDFTSAREAGGVILKRVSEDPDLIQSLAMQFGVFEMDMKQAVGELALGQEVIHLLPDEVGGIVV